MFLVSSINNTNITFTVQNIKRTTEGKLLEITTDYKLTFTNQLNNLCNTTSNRLRTLTRIRKYLSQEQTKRLSEAHIVFTFKYYPLICMFCGKTENKYINKIQKGTLRLIYVADKTFEDLLQRNKSRTIHKDNTHTLLAELYKSILFILARQ